MRTAVFLGVITGIVVGVETCPVHHHPKACPLPLEYDTDTTYHYLHLEIPTDTRRIEFQVKASSDVHIALSSSKRSSDLYEIVIGGWRNTQSAIRRCKQCKAKASKETSQFLSANGFRKFWITFGNNGAIAVGREGQTTPFMEWTDPDPLDIRYLGYSTGWGSSGKFRFCNLESPQCPSPLEYDTDTTYYYRYLGIPTGTRRIDFEVKAKSDVHIALSPTKNSSELYEIVIGGWGNTRSAIRRCKQCEVKTSAETIQYLNADEFRKFWVTFGINGAIAVGREDQTTAFMEWTDPDPLDIQYLGFSTGWGSSGEFRFCNLEPPQCPSQLGYETDTTFYYRYLEIPTGTRRIDFEVKAYNDVHIALSANESRSDLYEIVIGGWGNTRSVIRRCKQCKAKTTSITNQYLSANEFRKFWITFGNNGAIAVGREDESTPFMEWTDPNPLDIQYLGYSTGWGSSGEFRFCNLA